MNRTLCYSWRAATLAYIQFRNLADPLYSRQYAVGPNSCWITAVFGQTRVRPSNQHDALQKLAQLNYHVTVPSRTSCTRALMDPAHDAQVQVKWLLLHFLHIYAFQS